MSKSALKLLYTVCYLGRRGTPGGISLATQLWGISCIGTIGNGRLFVPHNLTNQAKKGQGGKRKKGRFNVIVYVLIKENA